MLIAFFYNMNKIFRPSLDKKTDLPLYGSKISAGFPSPADDYVEEVLDLNTLLIKNKTATYLVRVQGDSMKEAGIFEGDILVVDASLKPAHNKIVVAGIEGEFLVKRFCTEKGEIILKAENPHYPPIKIKNTDELSVFGVVVGVVRKMV